MAATEAGVPGGAAHLATSWWALFGDEELTPIRGQLTMLLPQPEVTYATVYENTYMFSRRDGIVLGGTHEMGDWNLQPDLTTKAAILAKQASLFEGMGGC